VKRSRLARAVAAGIALALLVLVLQQHRHPNAVESAKCVACAVHAQNATPPAVPLVVAAPVLVALDLVHEDDQQPPLLAAPIPHAQGPPSA